MRKVLLVSMVLLFGLLGCDPGAITAGVWDMVEIMDHRCRSTNGIGMICDPEEALDKGKLMGTIHIHDLGSSRLRLIDSDGRSTVGQSYSDGARFRWLEKSTSDSGNCVQNADELLELVTDDKGDLSGQRRVVFSYSDGCAASSVSDEGYVVSASPAEDR